MQHSPFSLCRCVLDQLLDTDIEVVNGHQAALSYTWEIMLTKKRTMLTDPQSPTTHTLNILWEE